MLNYINKTKGNLHKSFSLTEQKKLMLLLFDIWKLVKDIVKDGKMFDGAIAMHKRMM